MYLLFNNYKNVFRYSFISIFLIAVQFYTPMIKTSANFSLYVDLLLIYLTYLALNKELYLVIIFSFFIGLFQDFIIQSDTVGLYSFLKILSVYFISYIKKVNSLWNMTFKFLYLFVVYFFHYYIYHFVFINEMTWYLTGCVFIESFLNLFLFFLISKIINQSSII